MDSRDPTYPAPPVEKSATSVLSETLANISSLVRNEVNLARAELSENINRAVVAFGLLVASVVIALVALNVLAGAVVAALVELGLHAGWSAVVVGGVLAGIALAMALKGTSDLKLSSIAPTRAAERVQNVADAVKETYNDR